MPIAGKEIDLPEIVDFLNALKATFHLVAFVEKVGAMPGQGVTSMFSFGRNVGVIHGILAALNISYYLVAPQTWKKVILIGTDRSKQAAIDYCRRAFPQTKLTAGPRSTKPHDGLADAVCIAVYGRQQMHSLYAWADEDK